MMFQIKLTAVALAAVFLFAGQANAIAANPGLSRQPLQTFRDMIVVEDDKTVQLPRDNIDVEGAFDSPEIKMLEESSKRENGTECFENSYECFFVLPGKQHAIIVIIVFLPLNWHPKRFFKVEGYLLSPPGKRALIDRIKKRSLPDLEQRVEADDDENVVELIDSLEHSFTRYSNILVDDIAQTLVPAVRRVKEAHHVPNTRVDDDFGKGLWEFHETCKKMELAMLKDAEEVKEEYEAVQVRIADIMGKLEDAYARRDQLWVDFEVKLNSIVMDPTIEMLKELRARLERAISEIDKQSKKLNKGDVGLEKTLRTS
ncbi:hypothetical protein IW262DRAFT_1479605 [Armillaria fumosa]|nr:hypothetical protein IW262DRAFT_1479605 [Armillaria fumosa]